MELAQAQSKRQHVGVWESQVGPHWSLSPLGVKSAVPALYLGCILLTSLWGSAVLVSEVCGWSQDSSHSSPHPTHLQRGESSSLQ